MTTRKTTNEAIEEISAELSMMTTKETNDEATKGLSAEQKTFISAIPRIPTFLDFLKSPEGRKHFQDLPEFKEERIDWQLVCHTNWECLMACALFPGVHMKSVKTVFCLLKVYGMLDIDWLLTAGTVEERIDLLESVLIASDYKYPERAYELVGIAMFVRDLGGIPKDPADLLTCVGFSLTNTALFFIQQCEPYVPVVDLDVFSVCVALFSIENCENEQTDNSTCLVTSYLLDWFPMELFKEMYENIGAIRDIYQYEMKTNSHKSSFIKAIHHFFRDEKEIAVMITTIVLAKQVEYKVDDEEEEDSDD